VSAAGVRRTGFARSKQGLEYALVMDATGMTAGEVHEMSASDRYVTAVLRARFYRERSSDGSPRQNVRRQ
jgi:hypothetical protein